MVTFSHACDHFTVTSDWLPALVDVVVHLPLIFSFSEPQGTNLNSMPLDCTERIITSGQKLIEIGKTVKARRVNLS